MIKNVFNKINILESMWFADKCYFVGGAKVNPWDTSAKLCIIPRFNQGILKFNVKKCSTTGDLDFTGCLDSTIKYFNKYRILYYNIKTFFAKLKHIL